MGTVVEGSDLVQPPQRRAGCLCVKVTNARMYLQCDVCSVGIYKEHKLNRAYLVWLVMPIV